MERSSLSRRTFLTMSGGAFAAGVASTIPVPSCADDRDPSSGTPAAVAAGPQQSEEGVVYHRDIHKSDLMKGFPPPKHKRVTIENWTDTTDTVRWAQLNASAIFKCVGIETGNVPVRSLPRRMLAPQLLDRTRVLWGKTKEEAKSIPVAEWLRRSETDALVVLHDGHIVVEQYLGEMTPRTRHPLWSAGKSVLASVVARFLSNGVLDLHAPVTKYVPELSATGFQGATIRQLLDMHTGIRFRSFPSLRELRTSDETALKEWAWGSPEFRKARNECARYMRIAGAFPMLADEACEGLYDFLLTIKQDHDHGEYFYYADPNPMALQWALERATNTSYVEHVGRLLRDLGTEHGALLMLDSAGTGWNSGGLCLSARDFARWGQMLCQGGRISRGLVVPGIAALVDDIRRNPGPERWTERTNALAFSPPNTGYRGLTWTTPRKPGRVPVPFAHGAYHQKCYVDPDRRIVLVKFSSLTVDLQNREPYWIDDIAAQSFLDVLPELVR